MKVLAPEFERATKHKVAVSYGPAATLKRRPRPSGTSACSPSGPTLKTSPVDEKPFGTALHHKMAPDYLQT